MLDEIAAPIIPYWVESITRDSRHVAEKEREKFALYLCHAIPDCHSEPCWHSVYQPDVLCTRSLIFSAEVSLKA